MNYDELPSGEGMDMLVSERVMNWTAVGLEANSQHTEFVPHGIDPATIEARAEQKLSRRQRIPHYSTDIGDAWLVVEAIRAKSGSSFDLDDYGGNPWSVEISLTDGFVWGKGETAPLAICRAALKAVAKDKV